MTLTRIFYNNSLLITTHMKVSKHKTFPFCFTYSNAIQLPFILAIIN